MVFTKKKNPAMLNELCRVRVPRTRFELVHQPAPPPQDGASTNFATWAFIVFKELVQISL